MTYYPQDMPSYTEQQNMNGNSRAPPYAVPYEPPMRHNRGVSDGVIQQPGEEWVRGPDGAFYPQNHIPQRQRVSAPPTHPPPPPPPLRHFRQPSYNQNRPQERYWEN